VKAVVPNDPYFGSQWGLNQANDVDVDAPEAWQVTAGNPGVIVAVIDSGLELTQPEFSGRLWTNIAEYTGRPGVDDDRDGYVDDVYGWNFLNNNNDLSDRADHGTHVAGILAASGDNGFGVAGLDWNAKIMPLKFIGANSEGDVSQAVKAIYYAVQHGARVINASWGGPGRSNALEDAIQYANAAGVVFVTAAGNESLNNDYYRDNYPALSRYPNVLSVAGVDPSGNLGSYSNYGPTTVDVAAPGSGILSSLSNRRFTSLTGTSMATPFVAGVASLVVGLHPEWSAAQVREWIISTSKPLPALQGRIISGGIVSAGRAVGAPSTPVGANRRPTGPVAAGDQIRVEILGSQEYYEVRGGSDAAFVDSLYRSLLGRPLDSSAAGYWLGRLASGTSRPDVARAIIGSTEARRTKVARWLQSDLGWTPGLEALKALPAVASWADSLAVVGDSAVRAILLSSSEAYARSGGTDARWLDSVYRAALGRPLDSGGAALWLGYLARGTSRYDVTRMILGSGEAHIYRAATWFRDDLLRPTPIPDLMAQPGVVGFGERILD
jgi:subtilisin family serine protease